MSAGSKRRRPPYYTIGPYALRRDPGPVRAQWRVFDVTGPQALEVFVSPTLSAARDWCQSHRGSRQLAGV